MSGGVTVTQADRVAAHTLLGGAAPDGLLEGRDDSLSVVRALAAHRTTSQAELVEALRAVLDTSGARGTYDSLKYTDAVAVAEALLTKIEGDA